MHFLDLTLPSLEENLALDEALLLQAEAEGREWLRVWEWPAPAVVLGAAGRLAKDVDEPACVRDGVPIVRRSSGGGTVLLDSGCLLFNLVLSYERAEELLHIPSSYRYVLGRLRDALHSSIELAGTSDLACSGRKFSGNAQQRKRHHLLHHGTLLYSFDIRQVGRYLFLPERQPDYREKRGHADFLANIPLNVNELKSRLCACWNATAPAHAWPVATVRTLVADKYSKSEWIRRH